MKLPFEVIYHEGNMPLIEVVDEREWVPLVIVADVHRGASSCDEDVWHRVLRKAKELKAPVVGLGDLFENATKRSIGKGVFEQEIGPRDQVKVLKNDLEPLRDQIVELLPGNHEYRSDKENDYDPLDGLCEGLELRRGKYTVRIMFRSMAGSKAAYKKTAYTFRGTHSKSSSKTTGLAQNTIERDWEKWQNYDIIAKAHGHDMFVSEPKVYETVDRYNKVPMFRERWFVAGGHYLGFPESYCDQSVLRPKPLGTYVVWMRMNSVNREVKGEFVR